MRNYTNRPSETWSPQTDIAETPAPETHAYSRNQTHVCVLLNCACACTLDGKPLTPRAKAHVGQRSPTPWLASANVVSCCGIAPRPRNVALQTSQYNATVHIQMYTTVWRGVAMVLLTTPTAIWCCGIAPSASGCGAIYCNSLDSNVHVSGPTTVTHFICIQNAHA